MGLSNILARIVDFACNLVWIMVCDFLVELLADPNLHKAIVRLAYFASNLRGSADLYTPIHPSPQYAVNHCLVTKTVCAA